MGCSLHAPVRWCLPRLVNLHDLTGISRGAVRPRDWRAAHQYVEETLPRLASGSGFGPGSGGASAHALVAAAVAAAPLPAAAAFLAVREGSSCSGCIPEASPHLNQRSALFGALMFMSAELALALVLGHVLRTEPRGHLADAHLFCRGS